MSFVNYQRLSQHYDKGWGNFAALYVRFLETQFIERGMAQVKVLDLACGTGKLALELAKAGHTVFGVDLSSEMIEVARAKTVGIPNVSFDVQSMTKLEVAEKFDLVTCTFDSINYLLNPEDVQDVFLRVASILDRGGLFIFDANTEQMYLKHHHGTHSKEIEGDSFTIVLEYDQEKQIATTRFEFSDGVEIHHQRAYSGQEIELMLQRAGFRILHTFSSLKGNDVGQESERIFFVVDRV